jgi:Rad3-related DNA helicase
MAEAAELQKRVDHLEKRFVALQQDIQPLEAKHLKALAVNHPAKERLRFHDKFNKRDVLKGFIESTGNDILVAAGMTEGLDLKDDLARFNIIAKILWPSLEDPIYQRMLEERPDNYAWIAARSVMQAAGRVCRGPEDYGLTLILDSSYKRIPRHTWLRWYLDAEQFI